ncbi:MAG: glycosyltransferase [Candidatus Reddybacter sp.]
MPKKILFLSHDSSLQGAERCLIDFVSNLDRSRFEPLVVLPWKGPMEEHLTQANVPYTIRHLVRWIPSHHRATWVYPFSYLKRLRARLWSLLHIIEEEGIDLIYTNTSTLLEGALAANKLSIPHIWHIHEYLNDNPDIYSYLPNKLTDKITAYLSDQIITPSHVLAKNRFGTADNVHVVNNGVNLSLEQTGDGESIRDELNIPANAPIVTFIGSITATKDPLTFVRAALQIKTSKPETHFLIAGHTPNESLNHLIKDLIKKASFSENCHLLGFRNDVPNILASGTVHVSTSLREVMPINILEAMGIGKPVIATRCGGPEEVIIDNQTGLIVNVGDYNAVASAVLYLLDNPAKATAMGRAGKERVRKYYSTKIYINRISNIIEKTCNEHT